MAVYSWSGYNAKGKETRGMIDASSPKEAKLKLRSQGLFVSDLSEDATVAGKPGRELGAIFQGRIRLEDVTVMTRQLSTLVGAAIPLVDALSALYEQLDSPPLKKTIAQVRDAVNEGASFADALSHHKRVFPELYVNMVRSGEASGALDIVLLRLADFLEGQHRLKARVASAMIYPLLLLTVALAVLFYLLTAVVPKIVGMFDSMNQILPLPTRILISLSDGLQAAWWLILLIIAAAWYAVRRWRATPAGAYRFDRFKMRLPLFGKLTTKVAVARFARTLGTLLASGVPIIEALGIVKAVVLNRVLEQAIENTAREVTEGASIAAPLKSSGVFPPILVHMVGVGEKSGRLEEMLLKAAQAYEEDVETAVSTLTAVLEPVMILFMAVIAGFVVMAILFPMLEMSTVVR